ncbi:hypothetical protein ACMYSQ_010088 [Aspergillus niger]
MTTPPRPNSLVSPSPAPPRGRRTDYPTVVYNRFAENDRLDRGTIRLSSTLSPLFFFLFPPPAVRLRKVTHHRLSTRLDPSRLLNRMDDVALSESPAFLSVSLPNTVVAPIAIVGLVTARVANLISDRPFFAIPWAD